MPSTALLIAAEIAVSVLVVILITPSIIRNSKRMKLVGIDPYKPYKAQIVEMGGLSIIIGYSLGLFSVLAFISGEGRLNILAASASVLFLGMVGIIDDLFELRQLHKMVLPLFAAIPLMVVQAGETMVNLPFFGMVDLGIYYTLILIPVGIMVAANLTNMLAGFNGLETGLGIITGATIFVAALILDKPAALYIIAPLLGALVAFMVFNWYPARIFPGDTGALLIGTVIAATVIIANMELVGALVMTLYIINFLLYVVNIGSFRANDWKFGNVDKNGYIHPPDPKCWGAIYYLLPKLFRLKERGLVASIWLIQAIGCVSVLIWLVVTI